MSLWCSVKENVNGMYEMKSYYDQKRLYLIRERCANWIEEKLAFREITDASEGVAIQFYIDLENYIKCSAISQNDILRMINPLRDFSAMELYTHLINGLILEFHYIDEVTRSKQINKLECIQNIINSCNAFYQIISNNYPQHGTDQIINDLYNPVSYITNIFNEYEIWRDSVFGELKQWQRQQIGICCIDSQEKTKVNEIQIEKLNKIQNYLELLFEVTTKLLEMIEYQKNQNHFVAYTELDQLALKIVKQQENLIKDSFIVDNQPKQVIKTGLNFTCSVRWLLGPRLGSNFMRSAVKCVLVSETENQLVELSTELQENEVLMDYDDQSRVLSADFKSLYLKKIQRIGRRGSSDSVMDEKLALLFRVSTNNSIWALSVPLVVIVHGNQEHQALATIMWDNAFSKEGRHLFTVADRVSWTELAEALYSKCFAETKRGFPDANRAFFYEQLSPINNRTMSLPQQEIPWVKFCKDNLYGRRFTFWEWFHAAIKLIKEHLLKPWQHNLIEGFIGRNEAERKLSNAKPGTFLLRFSESVLGTITISYNIGNYRVAHIQPWNLQSLKHKCLADRILECLDIFELYPYGIHKSDLITEFGQSAKEVVNNGYLVPLTVTVVPPPSPDNSSSNSSDDMME